MIRALMARLRYLVHAVRCSVCLCQRPEHPAEDDDREWS